MPALDDPPEAANKHWQLAQSIALANQMVMATLQMSVWTSFALSETLTSQLLYCQELQQLKASTQLFPGPPKHAVQQACDLVTVHFPYLSTEPKFCSSCNRTQSRHAFRNTTAALPSQEHEESALTKSKFHPVETNLQADQLPAQQRGTPQRQRCTRVVQQSVELAPTPEPSFHAKKESAGYSLVQPRHQKKTPGNNPVNTSHNMFPILRSKAAKAVQKDCRVLRPRVNKHSRQRHRKKWAHYWRSRPPRAPFICRYQAFLATAARAWSRCV